MAPIRFIDALREGIAEEMRDDPRVIVLGEDVAVGGAFGTLSEIGHALGDGIPVIGLNSWELSINGDGTLVDGAIIPAYDPVDAVEKAVAAAETRN